MEITERQKQYLDLILQHQKEFKWARLVAKKMNIQENTVRVQLKRLVDLGFLRKDGAEKFSLAIPENQIKVLSMSFVKRQKRVEESKEKKMSLKQEKTNKSEVIRFNRFKVVTPSCLLPLEYVDGKLTKVPIPMYQL